MVGESHRAPVRNVAIFSLAEYSVEHPGRAEQSDMTTLERCERPAFDLIQLGHKYTARLSVRG